MAKFERPWINRVIPIDYKRSLPRLPRPAYLGRTTVFWTHSIQDRRTGWLNEPCYRQFREMLCHALSRHAAASPVFCLMPDHIHLLISGLVDSCDQWQCTRLIRQGINRLIDPSKLQAQAYDHVLKPEELNREAFESIAQYILENPVRKQLCQRWQEYPFTGCMVPGYFDLDPRQDGFWELYGRIHNRQVTATR